MTGLLFAQQIAGAANIEVVRSKLKAGTEGVEGLQYFKPTLGLRRDRLLCRQRKQCIGAKFRASDAPAQLVELRQAGPVSSMHNQRIGGWDIEPGFDGGGRSRTSCCRHKRQT